MAEKKYIMVASLQLGRTYSYYAFSTRHDFMVNPLKIHANSAWNAGSRQLVSLSTPTCLLLDKDKEFVAFGYDAEYWYAEAMLDGETDDYYFFQHFTTLLYNNKDVTDVMIIKDVTGKTLPASEVFELSIKYLVSHIIQLLDKFGQGVGHNDVQWVLTVPSSWTKTAKHIMKLSAEWAGIKSDNLVVVPESDSAFVYGHTLWLQDKNYTQGNGKYMVVDLGDFAAEITVFNYNKYQLIQRYHTTDNDCGGNLVYKQFLEVLEEIVGESTMKSLKENDPSAYLDIEKEFESRKRSIYSWTKGRITLTIPVVALDEVCRKHHELDFESLVKVSIYATRIKLLGDKMRIDPDTFRNLFKTTIDNVISLIERVCFGYRGLHIVMYIIMAGGFSDCSLVQDAVKEYFPTKRIIIPEDASTAVAKGSVLYGHQPCQYIRSQSQQLLHAYEKKPSQKGFLLVINFRFPGSGPGPKERKASEEDVLKLCDFFYKLDYDIDCRSDMTTAELKACLENVKYNYLTRESHKYYCFICVIMSHGNKKGISTTDGIIEVHELIRPFKNDNASSFVGKPKIFMLLACRGDEPQVKQRYVHPNSTDEADSANIVRMPTDADIITIYATTPGYYSYRKVTSTTWKGTWFVQAFLTVAHKHPKNHLLEILTAVNYELANNPEYEIEGERCQLSMTETALSKLFYF